MNFKSRKDPLFQLIFLGVIALCLVIVTIGVLSPNEDKNDSWGYLIVLLVVGLLTWIILGTSYQVRPSHIYYKCGPFRGRIALEMISKIEKGTTMWAGYRMATARNGLIIHYKGYRRVYISPDSNDTFIAELQKYSKDIEIIGKG